MSRTIKNKVYKAFATLASLIIFGSNNTFMYSHLIEAIEQEIKTNPVLFEELQELGDVIHLKKNEYLLNSGETCRHGYFINSGSLVQTYTSASGKEVVHGFYIDESFRYVSSVRSYFSGNGAHFEIKALENCELLQFTKDDLEYLSVKYPEFSLYYHKITANGFQNLFMFNVIRLSHSAEEYFEFLWKEHPVYLERIPDKYIAQFMGISKEWFSKLKRKRRELMERN